jgi:hypothetical protein
MQGMFRALCAVAAIFILLLMAGCGHNLPATTQKLPHYPGAVNWVEREPDSDQRLLNIYNTASFTTSDDPESVLNFYRDTLTGDGWEIDPFQPDPSGLTLRWTSEEQPPATYLCIVTVGRGNSNVNIQIELRYNPGS